MGTFLVNESREEITLPDSQNISTQTYVSRKKAGNTIQVVEFVIGDELFAVDLFDTREVITTPEVTSIPNSPPFVTGMIDLRGVITTIIDLREVMHITTEAIGKKRSRIIVLDSSVIDKMIGILVDDVHSVTTYTKEDIDQDAHSSADSHRDIIGIIRKHKKDGAGKEKSSLIIWLDIRTMIKRIENEL